MEHQLESSIFSCRVISAAAIHLLKGYMEQIIFDSSYLLWPATFSEDLSDALIFKREFYLFNRSNYSHPSLEVAHLFLWQKNVTHSLKWSLSLSFNVPLSFAATNYHLLSLFVISCHSITRCHSLSLDCIACLFINGHSALPKFIITY